MSWISSLFKKKETPELPRYEGAKSQMELTGGNELYKQILSQKGAAERLKDIYYNELFKPTADYVRSTRDEQIVNPIMAQAGAMGMARSTKISDDLASRIAQQELGLAEYGGELKTQGYETGLNQENLGLNALQNWVGNEGNLNMNYATNKYNRDTTQYGLNRQTEAVNAQRLPNTLQTAGTIASLLLPAFLGANAASGIATGRNTVMGIRSGGIGRGITGMSQYGNTWSPLA